MFRRLRRLIGRLRPSPLDRIHTADGWVEETEFYGTGVGSFVFEGAPPERTITVQFETRAGLVILAVDEDDAEALAGSLTQTLEYYRYGIVGDGMITGPELDPA